MRWSSGAAIAALLFLPLSSCASEPDSPGAVTADEDRQLNEAAEMLDANSVGASVADDNGSDR